MKNSTIVIIGVIVYVVFGIIITPFLGYNFGTKPTVIVRTIMFFIEYPFGLIKELSEYYFILMLVLNGFLWSFLILKILQLIKKIYVKITKKTL